MLADELRPMTEEEIEEMLSVAPLADDENPDEGDPSVFTLFDPVYEVELGQYWYTSSNRTKFHLMKTRTNEVVFLEEIYSDNPGAESQKVMTLPEELRPLIRADLVVSYEKWDGTAKPARVVTLPNGEVVFYPFTGDARDGNIIRLAGQSFNCCSKHYLEV